MAQKLKPFIVFKGAKREAAALNEEFKKPMYSGIIPKCLDERRACFAIFENGFRNVVL